MLWRVTLLLISCYPLAWMMNIAVINNAMFAPINSTYWLGSLYGITSRNQCICQCYTNSNCNTIIYYGRYQICLLFSANLWQGQLQWMATSENTTVISFSNRSLVSE
ncbi:unnamed protein product [Rotaria sp. Silwood2]|nr:unnamed protein product [Rotaria sp. Silwood2]